jgi:creatinine amidohydrolase
VTTGNVQWANFVELRPDDLQRIVDETPVVYWPLGLIEHHGWPSPVGFDGLNARGMCLRMVQRTGGLMMPVMWWGGGGGHDPFKWTFYQPMDATQAIFENTMRKLIDFGFRCIVPWPGHGPWSWILDKVLPPLVEAHPDLLIVGAPGVPRRPEGLEFKNGHAGRWEAAYGLAHFPELMDLDAPGRDRDVSKVWPPGQPPPEGERHPKVNFDASSPRFAQVGEDARDASAEDVEATIRAVVDHVAGLVGAHLAGA